MTITEIARQANVSIATVDRVLHNRGRVAKETKDRIEKIVKDSGYQPDPLARHLKKRGHYKIGVIIPLPDSAYGYWKKILTGIKQTAEEELSAFSFATELFPFTRNDDDSLNKALNNIIDSTCDAFIIAPIMEEQIKSFLTSNEISKPYCFVDSQLPGCSPISEIAQNPFAAGFAAGRLTHLVSNKSGTYVAIKPYKGAFNLDQRAKGFCSWFEENQKDLKAVTVTKAISEESAENVVKDLIKQYPDLCGICSVSVETFLLGNVIQKMGLKDKIAVIGFDLVDSSKQALTEGSVDALIHQEPRYQGVLAVRQLFKKLVYEEDVENSIHIPIRIYFKENLI